MSDSPIIPPGQLQVTSLHSPQESRRDLLSRAQAFLTSPQIKDQGDAAKREFLTEKGLAPAEVDHLLQGIVSLSTSTRYALRKFKPLTTSPFLPVEAVQGPQHPSSIVPAAPTVESARPTRRDIQDLDVGSRWVYRDGFDALRT